MQPPRQDQLLSERGYSIVINVNFGSQTVLRSESMPYNRAEVTFLIHAVPKNILSTFVTNAVLHLVDTGILLPDYHRPTTCACWPAWLLPSLIHWNGFIAKETEVGKENCNESNLSWKI